MSPATAKTQSSRDEAAVRALVETVHQGQHDKDARALEKGRLRREGGIRLECAAHTLVHLLRSRV